MEWWYQRPEWVQWLLFLPGATVCTGIFPTIAQMIGANLPSFWSIDVYASAVFSSAVAAFTFPTAVCLLAPRGQRTLAWVLSTPILLICIAAAGRLGWMMYDEEMKATYWEPTDPIEGIRGLIWLVVGVATLVWLTREGPSRQGSPSHGRPQELGRSDTTPQPSRGAQLSATEEWGESDLEEESAMDSYDRYLEQMAERADRQTRFIRFVASWIVPLVASVVVRDYYGFLASAIVIFALLLGSRIVATPIIALFSTIEMLRARREGIPIDYIESWMAAHPLQAGQQDSASRHVERKRESTGRDSPLRSPESLILRRALLTGLIAGVTVVALHWARSWFDIESNYLWGAIYFASCVVGMNIAFHHMFTTIISQSLGAIVFAVGATLTVNWALGIFVLAQLIQGYTNHAEAEPAFNQSLFERTYSARVGNFCLVGTAIGVIYFLIAVAGDLLE